MNSTENATRVEHPMSRSVSRRFLLPRQNHDRMTKMANAASAS